MSSKQSAMGKERKETFGVGRRARPECQGVDESNLDCFYPESLCSRVVGFNVIHVLEGLGRRLRISAKA
jgi:hypothetical protein